MPLNRFNPHPPLLAGETPSPAFDESLRYVSIHTRHYWRVKRGCQDLAGMIRAVSIHTRHYWRVKRRQVTYELVPGVFQSTPAITGG